MNKCLPALTGTTPRPLALRPKRPAVGGLLVAARERLSRMPRPRPTIRVRCRVRRVPRAGPAAAAVGRYRDAADACVADAPVPAITVWV